ncbi:MAG: hypothetical protein JWO13_3725 [Acidobacteriales bacterium]|nr:hypothetical protein [Terriglobales bacterium]
MESKNELNRYVIRWHGDLMNEVERQTQRHLFATLKATMGRSDNAAQSEARKSAVYARMLSNDPEVLHVASQGHDAFVERTAARILAECGSALAFNRCPNCDGLARTPRSRQCRFCGHDWHAG